MQMTGFHQWHRWTLAMHRAEQQEELESAQRSLEVTAVMTDMLHDLEVQARYADLHSQERRDAAAAMNRVLLVMRSGNARMLVCVLGEHVSMSRLQHNVPTRVSKCEHDDATCVEV